MEDHFNRLIVAVLAALGVMTALPLIFLGVAEPFVGWAFVVGTLSLTTLFFKLLTRRS